MIPMIQEIHKEGRKMDNIIEPMAVGIILVLLAGGLVWFAAWYD